MKVYLAGPYQWKNIIATYAAELRKAGVTVTSRWLEEPHSPTTQCGDLPDATFAKYAIQDLEDIDQAEILVLFAVPGTPIPRAGRHVEFGYALAKNKKLVVVGNVKENIFHYLPGITPFATWEDTLQWFKDLRLLELGMGVV